MGRDDTGSAQAERAEAAAQIALSGPYHPVVRAGFPLLPSSRFVPTPELFWHASDLHGQAHVSRVMVHAIRLIEATGQHAPAPRLWAAVFLHDLARRHDGVNHRHGADAARRLREEPALQARLAEAGLVASDYPAIEAAVTAHSAPKEAVSGPRALAADCAAEGRGRPRSRAARRPRRALSASRGGEDDGPVCAGTVRRDGWRGGSGRWALRGLVARGGAACAIEDRRVPLRLSLAAAPPRRRGVIPSGIQCGRCGLA